jgi:hypothetical protein
MCHNFCNKSFILVKYVKNHWISHGYRVRLENHVIMWKSQVKNSPITLWYQLPCSSRFIFHCMNGIKEKSDAVWAFTFESVDDRLVKSWIGNDLRDHLLICSLYVQPLCMICNLEKYMVWQWLKMWPLSSDMMDKYCIYFPARDQEGNAQCSLFRDTAYVRKPTWCIIHLGGLFLIQFVQIQYPGFIDPVPMRNIFELFRINNIIFK